jgi:hypothetical protein
VSGLLPSHGLVGSNPFLIRFVSANALPRTDLCPVFTVPPVRAVFSLIMWHLGLRQNLVARLLVNLEFCRIRFWYPVAPGSGICRETGRNYFWNLTLISLVIFRSG